MPYEPSRPYRYLQSLAEDHDKLGKKFWWFVSHFLSSPRIPWDYWLFCIDSESSNAPHRGRKIIPAVLCIITYYLAWNYFKTQLTQVHWLRLLGGTVTYGIIISITVNLLTLLMIDLFALPYKESAKALEDKLNARIKELQTSITKHINEISNDILGHKFWARPETHQLFLGLSAENSGTRAKWFIVNFLSHLANDRIDIRNEINGDLYSLSTGQNDWPVSLYSKFLAKNMDHAESEILWLVDPDDFFWDSAAGIRRLCISCSDGKLLRQNARHRTKR